MNFIGNTENLKIEEKLVYKDFSKVAGSNTLLMTLELIFVSAGEVVLDNGRDDPVQPGLAVNPHDVRYQNIKTHFCSLSGSIENHGNADSPPPPIL